MGMGKTAVLLPLVAKSHLSSRAKLRPSRLEPVPLLAEVAAAELPGGSGLALPAEPAAVPRPAVVDSDRSRQGPQAKAVVSGPSSSFPVSRTTVRAAPVQHSQYSEGRPQPTYLDAFMSPILGMGSKPGSMPVMYPSTYGPISAARSFYGRSSFLQTFSRTSPVCGGGCPNPPQLPRLSLSSPRLSSVSPLTQRVRKGGNGGALLQINSVEALVRKAKSEIDF